MPIMPMNFVPGSGPHYDFENLTTFEDPFSYPARPTPYEPPADAEPFPDAPSPEVVDNKLLSFSAPVAKADMVDVNGRLVDMGMTAELYGMFFVAEDVFGAEGGETSPPLELTCYRRNLWQCSGQITLPRYVSQVINEQNRHIPISELAASITAVESIDGKLTEIISIPWKTSNPSTEDIKVPGAPQNITLGLTAGHEVDSSRVSVPVAWRRLQFKHATANNGRRKGMQQHYVVRISLLGKMKSGEFMKIAEIESGAVIVRGRSPRNFDSTKEIPLSGTVDGKKHPERRNMTAAVKSDHDMTPGPVQRFNSTGTVQVRPSPRMDGDELTGSSPTGNPPKHIPSAPDTRNRQKG